MKKFLFIGFVLSLFLILALNVDGEGLTSSDPSVKVYTAGCYKDGDKEVACYWKDTTKIDLPGDDIHNSIASSIFVSDNTVYTAGNIRNNTIACYWKDTTRTDLIIDIYRTTEANSIYVVGDKVYTAGHYHDVNDFHCYWAGTKRTDLTIKTKNDPGVYRSNTLVKISSIFASKGKVYVAGVIDETPCYWVGSTRIDLPIPKGDSFFSNDGSANLIFISDNTVYIAGYYHNGFKSIPCYWKGRDRIDLFLTG